MYCTANSLRRYIHYQYLVKLDEIRAGAVQEHVDQVNSEVTEALMQGGYQVPTVNTSALLSRIASVIAAWHCVGEMTSPMNTERDVDNEYIPLQKNYERAIKDLEAIREGLLNPFPEAAEIGSVGGGVVVVAPVRIFDEDLWELF